LQKSAHLVPLHFKYSNTIGIVILDNPYTPEMTHCHAGSVNIQATPNLFIDCNKKSVHHNY